MTKEEFYNRWMETFANSIPKKDIIKYVKSTGNYIWHIFSWELLTEKHYLVGEKAREAYDRIDKNGAFYIEWFEDEQTKDMILNLSTAKNLDDLVEVYVVVRDIKWTYIKTHESMCGPYFMKKQ